MGKLPDNCYEVELGFVPLSRRSMSGVHAADVRRLFCENKLFRSSITMLAAAIMWPSSMSELHSVEITDKRVKLPAPRTHGETSVEKSTAGEKVDQRV